VPAGVTTSRRPSSVCQVTSSGAPPPGRGPAHGRGAPHGHGLGARASPGEIDGPRLVDPHERHPIHDGVRRDIDRDLRERHCSGVDLSAEREDAAIGGDVDKQILAAEGALAAPPDGEPLRQRSRAGGGHERGFDGGVEFSGGREAGRAVALGGRLGPEGWDREHTDRIDQGHHAHQSHPGDSRRGRRQLDEQTVGRHPRQPRRFVGDRFDPGEPRIDRHDEGADDFSSGIEVARRLHPAGIEAPEHLVDGRDCGGGAGDRIAGRETAGRKTAGQAPARRGRTDDPHPTAAGNVEAGRGAPCGQGRGLLPRAGDR